MNLLLSHILVLPNYKVNETLVYGYQNSDKSEKILQTSSFSTQHQTKLN